MKKLLLVLASIILFFSCEEIKTDPSLLPSSTGKYGEVLIVVDTLYENRQTGEAINQIFFKALDGLPQEESQFRASTVSSGGFKSILKRSRNILKLNIGSGKKTNIAIKNNVWAKDQLLIQITADSDASAARILTKNLETIRNYFNEEEIARLQRQFKIKREKELMAELTDEYGVQMIVPFGFVKMSNDENGFWLKKEKTVGEHPVLQGVSVYIKNYESDSAFENAEMIRLRNAFTEEHIQGYKEGSFMTVYEGYNPVNQEINLNGFYSKEYRGLWNMKNDFMGGPFVHYTLVDEKNNRLINLDGFVYAPKFNKREYLRELEAMLKTFAL